MTLELVRDPARLSELHELTPREREFIAVLMLEAPSNEQIAERLVITPNTVKFHLTSLMRKLGVSSRTEVVAYAWQCGIVVEGQWHPTVGT